MTSTVQIVNVKSPATTLLAIPPAQKERLLRLFQPLGIDLQDDSVPQESAANASEDLPTGAPMLLAVDMEGEQLETLLATQGMKALLPYRNPNHALLESIMAGNSASSAVAAWQESARRVMDLRRRHRHSTLLFDIDIASENPAAFAKTVGKWLEVSLDATDIAPLEHTREVEDRYRLVVAQALRQSVEAVGLLQELEASAVPLVSETEPECIDCDAILEQLWAEGATTKDEQRALEQDRDALREENELLLLQLHQVQEELESYYLQLEDVQAKSVERDAVLRKKHRNLVHHETRCKTLAAENKRLEIELARYRRALTNVHRSTSWRVSRPIRVFKRLFARKPRKPVS